MNTAKITRLESALNGTARKVLDAVPLQDAWTKPQIVNEIRRLGFTVHANALGGCIKQLLERGLIKETDGTYTRVAARISEEIEMNEQAPAKPPATKEDMLSRLARIGGSLRAVADEIDALALEVEDTKQNTDKLRQLKDLLASIQTT